MVILFYRHAYATQHPSMTKKRATRKQAVTVVNSLLEISAIGPSRERHVIPTVPDFFRPASFLQMARLPARQGTAHSASATCFSII
ncbi:hypothetical protein Zmor_002317 [Zophobas morio]|uniref:Uncharacterized protein n=1 Tax=Zophobas morio TaxID=2755281 RepID=A0AA38MTG8_9CUCU|nr:hypothetical protein Zmor_002317 [Zophobas morio]